MGDLADFDPARRILDDVKAKGAALETIAGLSYTVRAFAVMEFTLSATRRVSVDMVGPSPASGNVDGNAGVRIMSGGEVVAAGTWQNVVTATLAAGTHWIVLSLATGWSPGAPANMTQMDMRVTAADGAGSLTGPLDAYPPTGFALARAGASGVRATWNPPALVHAGQTLEGYQLAVQLTAGGAWTAWPGTLPPDTMTLTVPAGVSGDSAWRIRAVYAGGATGTEYSGWETASVAAVFATGAAHAAGGGSMNLTATTGDGEVTLSWTDPNLRVASVWPFGDCEGYDQAFNATASTWWRSELLDLGAAKGVSVTVNVEHYEPPLRVSGAGGAVGAVAPASRDDGPAFASDLGVQVWVAGAAIAEVALPFAEAGGQEVTYRVDGLPRGVHVGDVRNLTGTPTLAAGTEGVARVTRDHRRRAGRHQLFRVAAGGRRDQDRNRDGKRPVCAGKRGGRRRG